MRIIAGKFKGKILKDFNLDTTKPTLDRVKEAIFSIIQFDLLDAEVLDLFSGTGSLGIEALSRGAKNVDFVDNNPKAIEIIKNNLKSINSNLIPQNVDYSTFLNAKIKQNKKYDIILIDAPYASNYGSLAVETIVDNNMLNQGGKIIYEKSYAQKYSFEKEGYFVKCKKYGHVEIVIIEKI